jgi:hypothetical protein
MVYLMLNYTNPQFFDLAWTMTFANLSNSTELTTLRTLGSYAVFFALAWWLWAAQVVYDVKVRTAVIDPDVPTKATNQYYTNDWFHRIMLLIQLVMFGALSSFTKDFDPFNYDIDPDKVSTDKFL